MRALAKKIRTHKKQKPREQFEVEEVGQLGEIGRQASSRNPLTMAYSKRES